MSTPPSPPSEPQSSRSAASSTKVKETTAAWAKEGKRQDRALVILAVVWAGSGIWGVASRVDREFGYAYLASSALIGWLLWRTRRKARQPN